MFTGASLKFSTKEALPGFKKANLIDSQFSIISSRAGKKTKANVMPYGKHHKIIKHLNLSSAIALCFSFLVKCVALDIKVNNNATLKKR